MSEDWISRLLSEHGTRAHLSSKEVAYYLRVSPRHLQRLRSTGKGPPFRIHFCRPIYRVDELLVWSDSRRRTRGHV